MNIQKKYIYMAVIVYSITAFFSLGHLHPDEYYQILEFAAYKLQLNSPNGLTWEFYEQIRPAFQSWLIVYLYKLITLLTYPNPFIVAFLSRLFAGILSLATIILFLNTFLPELNSKRKQYWFILFSLFSWLIVFNGVRYSSENIAAKLFILGLCLLLHPKIKHSTVIYLLSGFIVGMSFVTRFQVGFMIAGLFGWLLFIKHLKPSGVLILILGILLAIICGCFIDHWFYGKWVFTPWRYFVANILEGKAATFSVDPWYMYLAIAGLIPYGPLYIIASLYFMLAKRKHVLSWIMLPFIVAHLLVGHKELRFLTPLLNFMPFVILMSLQSIEDKYNWRLNAKLVTLNCYAWGFNYLLVLIVMFFPSAMQIRINELLYKRYHKPAAFNYITEGGNILDFYKHLNLRPVAINAPDEVKCNANENCLLALTCQETLKYKAPSSPLIFSDCPQWIFKLDFNGWLERTALYNIYELKTIESNR